MPWEIAFYASGEHFHPSQIAYDFSEAHDPGPRGPQGRHKYGLAIIEVSTSIPNEDRIRYLVNLVLPLMPDIVKAGATDCQLDIARYYSTQCHEELSAEELALIARLQCTLCYTAYQMSEEDELEMKSKLENY